MENPPSYTVPHTASVPPTPDPDLGTNAPPASSPRRLADIRADLAKPVPERVLKSKVIGGSQLVFIPWYKVVQILDYYCNGFWNYEIVSREISGGFLFMTVRITITALDDDGHHIEVMREGTGLEEMTVGGYGDPSSNAESMAFRRACAKFGLGLYLYEKEGV